MTATATPLLMRGKVIPTFTLPDATGRLLSRTSFRGHKHLVLLFIADLASSTCYLQDLGDVASTIGAASGAILVITRPNSYAACTDQPLFPFALLIDADGATTLRFLPSDVSNGLFITDRYGELYYQALADKVGELPPATEIVRWVEAIDNQCSI